MTTAQPTLHDQQPTIAQRLGDVHARITAAAVRAGRDPQAVTLVAVAKTFESDAVAAARAAGQVDIGESRAQELSTKREELGDSVRWHFVGRLQRNKVADVVGAVALVHSLDRPALADALADRAQRLGIVQRTLLQVNVDDDETKAGCAPDEVLRLLARVRELPHLACLGLTTIPSMDADPRPAFAQLRALRDQAAERYPEVVELSMGMSGDFDTAVEEGATLVRVGEGVFGSRQGD